MTNQEYTQGKITAIQAVWHKTMNEVLCDEIEAARTKIILLEDQIKTLKKIIEMSSTENNCNVA